MKDDPAKGQSAFDDLRRSSLAFEEATRAQHQMLRLLLEPFVRQATQAAVDGGGAPAGGGEAASGQLVDLLTNAQRLLLQHPVAMQAGFSALVAEGRRVMESEQGRDLARSLEASPWLENVRRVFETTTLNLLEESPSTVLPSRFVELLASAPRREDLSERLEEAQQAGRGAKPVARPRPVAPAKARAAKPAPPEVRPRNRGWGDLGAAFAATRPRYEEGRRLPEGSARPVEVVEAARAEPIAWTNPGYRLATTVEPTSLGRNPRPTQSGVSPPERRPSVSPASSSTTTRPTGKPSGLVVDPKLGTGSTLGGKPIRAGSFELPPQNAAPNIEAHTEPVLAALEADSGEPSLLQGEEVVLGGGHGGDSISVQQLLSELELGEIQEKLQATRFDWKQ